MSRVIFALLVCALAFVNFSECAPTEAIDSEAETFDKRRDESIDELIKLNGITCENLEQKCQTGKDYNDETDSAMALFCRIMLEPIVCENAVSSE